jgi:Cu/Ag efflux pump CusA
MIHRIVQLALQQRFLVLMLTILMIVAGAWSFQQMPVDAYPDLSPPMVELITQWPGHAAAEVERLTTLPLELAMNGSPRLRIMRSISLYGLSDVILTFEDGVGPLAIFMIFLILFALYANFKFPITIALGVVITEPVGALIALKLTHTPFSVSSVLGLLALLGVSVETAVILVSYINKLRLEDRSYPGSYVGRVAVAIAADYDDRTGGMSGTAASGHVDGRWQRHGLRSSWLRGCCHACF